MTYNYDLQPTLTISSEDLERIRTGTIGSAFTVSDPFKEEIYISIDNKLRKYSNVIYDILKDLGRIEIERDEWLSLIEAKMKE